MTKHLAHIETDVETLAEARVVFDRLAQMQIELAAANARLERRIATIKADHELQTNSLREDISFFELRLLRFIEQHPEHFGKPRTHKTSFGEFGLRQTKTVLVNDQEAALDYLRSHGLKACFEMPAVKLMKGNIRKQIEGGEKIPGARLLVEDQPTWTVAKALIDEAVKKGAGEP